MPTDRNGKRLEIGDTVIIAAHIVELDDNNLGLKLNHINDSNVMFVPSITVSLVRFELKKALG